MSAMTLYIANKTYSSWSFRPWIAMTVKELPFEEVLVPFDDDGGNPKFREFSPTGKVPVLDHSGATVWESLAILEHLADYFPEMRFWPEDLESRSLARCVSAEMAAGFATLRANCPMNMRREPSAVTMSDALKADVARVETIWKTLLERSGGPFLFGPLFGVADAMYAPVVNRFEVYRLSEDETARGYMETIKALPAWKAWEEAAREEPWTVAADEA
ncbi:glutathione S-transferase family protein [Pararhizobium mangrovi]|uniref:Glutathione S-transferase family protein n=1 Tax=Pararhizobium mangrovi TaxID=2590452 RepID=A0A506U8J0_9HYPH|nr:glutathione S-transferase family protein [Pararhizobium mangrovi]TPW30742.1 glutathione S-transferase family protein [Pararhizobium mangrovi]